MRNVLIVLNYNDFKNTINYINSVLDFKKLDNIIIVDNNSSDDSFSKLNKLKGKKIEIIKTEKNKGYAYGNNFGAFYAIKKYGKCNLIISNNDILIKEDDFNNLIKSIEKMDAISPVIKENGSLNRGWRLPSTKDEIKLSLPHNRNIVVGYNDEHYRNDVSYVDVLSGSFFIIKSDVFLKVKGFDENTFLYYEENILFSKLKKFGAKVGILNTSSIIHNHSQSISKSLNNYKKTKILKQSQEYYVKKYCKHNIFNYSLLKVLNKIVLLNSKLKNR